MAYRYEATSVAGFIQQLAVGYLCRGYYFYVSGEVQASKDPALLDEKLIAKYDIRKSKFTRCRERRRGIASIQYLRFQRFFVILATEGKHRFFIEEASAIRDVRETPIQFAGHSIGYVQNRGKGHPSVRIARSTFEGLRRHFSDIAAFRSAEELVNQLRALPFEPYAPVRNQLYQLLRLINEKRRRASLGLIEKTALKRGRRPVAVFGQAEQKERSESRNVG